MRAHICRPPRAKKPFQRTFTDGFRDDIRFERKLQEGTITRPDAHAGLAAGEVQTGMLSDENVDISLDLVMFREHVAETQKPLRV